MGISGITIAWYYGEKIKNKKKKNPRYGEGCNEDNPLTPFNKGELREKQHCDIVIDTTLPLRFLLKSL